MKTIIKITTSMFLLTISSIAVADSNNRTYLAARPQLANMPLTAATFYSQANNDNPSFGGTWQATAFFEQSVDHNAAGKYFTFTNNNSFAIKGSVADRANTADATADALPANFALDQFYDGVITFRPQRTSYGVHLTYQQELNHLMDQLYFTVAAPVVAIEHTLGMSEKINANPTPGASTFANVSSGKRLPAGFSQSVMAARISNQRVVGLADVKAGLGYRFFQSSTLRLQGDVNVTAPTGGDITGRQMFEAVVGSGHWALGLGFAGRANLWHDEENEDHRFSLWLMGDIKYLLQATEDRTIGFADKQKAGAQFASMLQQDPVNNANLLAGAVPGANVMTRALRVTPGVQAEGLFWGDYTSNAWKIGGGYNVFARQTESVSLRDDWYAPGTYGLTGRGGAAVDSASTIKINAATGAGGLSNGQFITPVDLDLLACKAAVSHKLAGQVSYALGTDNPSYVGVGGGYEFAGSNDLLSMWQMWCKFGISF